MVHGVAQGHQTAETVADQNAGPKSLGDGIEISGQLGQGVPSQRTLAETVSALVVQHDVMGLGHNGRQAEVPRGQAPAQHPVNHDHRRCCGIAQVLDVEAKPVGGHERHATMNPTSCPTVNRMICSSSIPATQSTKSTESP
jgi:hypothetical protein